MPLSLAFGIIGTWAGPDEPGTAYVMIHHSIGDVGDGHLGGWGFAEGGMGAVSDALRRSAEELGAEVRTSAPVERVIVKDGRAVGVALRNGDELSAQRAFMAGRLRIGGDAAALIRAQGALAVLPDLFAAIRPETEW